MKAELNNNNYQIEISKDEALVLFEWLHQLLEEKYNPVFRHTAEEIVVSNIIGALQSELIEPFDKNYVELVIKARERINW